jgi:UDPglucose 6-dehydrogenase
MIGVIGLGFVGLTTALGFSERGVPTMGYDIDETKLNVIRSGEIPFYEPGLKEALSRNLGKNFTIVGNMANLVDNSEIIFICVGTPKGSDGNADLSQISSVIDAILSKVKADDKKIILIKSTVPPSTTDYMQDYIYKNGEMRDGNLIIGMNPEFLREGHAWEDFTNPDRIVVGISCDNVHREKIAEVYKNFRKEIIFTNSRTAEFLKYLSNTLLSTMVSFSNEMSVIAKSIGGIDIAGAFKMLHLDKRFSGNPANIVSYIYPGCGYGGYCLPKDTEAIVRLSENLGFRPNILEGNISMNENIMNFLVNDFAHKYEDKSLSIGILGLSFKQDSDDIRETPASRCIETLKERGYNKIIAYDPMAMSNFAKAHPTLKITYAKSAKELIKVAQAIFIITAWKEFANLDFQGKRVYNLRYMHLKHYTTEM